MGRGGDFGGTITTIQDNIIAMSVNGSNNNKRKSNYRENTSNKGDRQPPPFLNHYK